MTTEANATLSSYKVLYSVTEKLRFTTRTLKGRIELHDDHAAITSRQPLTLRYSQIEGLQAPCVRGAGSMVHFRCADRPVFVAVPRSSCFLAGFAVINCYKTWEFYSLLIDKVTHTSRLEPGDTIIQETDWSITFRKKGDAATYHDSKFRLRKASITYPELCLRWPGWSPSDRLDFCQAAAHLEQVNTRDIFRFLARDETETIRMTIAFGVARFLPAEEAFSLLSRWADEMPMRRRANIYQAIVHTQHPQARIVLEQHYRAMCEDPKLMDGYNDIADELVWLIDSLIYAGVPMESLRPTYEKLANHPSRLIRERTEQRLAETFLSK